MAVNCSRAVLKVFDHLLGQEVRKWEAGGVFKAFVEGHSIVDRYLDIPLINPVILSNQHARYFNFRKFCVNIL